MSRTGVRFAQLRPCRLLPLLVVVGAIAFPVSLSAQTSADAGPRPDLAGLFQEGRLVRDLSGDGVTDALSVRIVVPDTANVAEIATAANLAARLGYETSAARLGLVVDASQLDVPDVPVLIVGDALSPASDAGTDLADHLSGTAPGEGVLVHLPPTDPYPAGGAILLGHDATGLLEIGTYVAGRFPEVWALDGDEWGDVAAATSAFVEARGGGVPSVELQRLVVDATRPGVARATVRVTFPAGTDLDPLERALRGEGVEAAESGSQRPDPAVTPRAETTVTEIPVADTTVTDTTVAEIDAPIPLASLHFEDLDRLDVELVAGSATRTVAVRPEEPWETRIDGDFRPDGDTGFGLPELYEVDGLYRDTNRDLVPDEVEGYLSVASGASAGLVADLAARIGLESAGLRAPLVVPARQTDEPGSLGFPVAIGSTHPWLTRLLDDDGLPGWTGASGAGSVRLVEDAFGGRDGMVVAGADDIGTDAALDWLAGTAPYLRTHERGGYDLDDARTHARRTLQGRTAGGQAALALHKLDSWMRRLAEEGSMAGAPLPSVVGDSVSTAGMEPRIGRAAAPSRVEVELAVESAQSGLDDVTTDLVRSHFPDAEIDVRTWSTGFGVGDTIYQRAFDLGWEVDDARALLETRLYPAVDGTAPVSVELRVSEPPEVREQLADEIRDALSDRGADDPEVRVINAYKQGYSWLTDVVLARLRAEGLAARVADVRIEYHTLQEADDVRWQTIAAETRWLQELYPVDAVLADELELDVDRITFHPVRRPESIYRVEITDAAGEVILTDDFHPAWVVRPLFDLFPDYEQVRVTTGRLRAAFGDETVLNERVVTDPERFWDRLQTDVYGRVIEYVMDVQDGAPSGANAPYFDEFRLDLRLSEPDHRIGVQEEVVSSLEAMHEDFYFQTLTLFDLIGDRYGVGDLDYPGRILPYIDPTGAGEPGHATFTLTGKQRGVPELVVRAHGIQPGDRPVPEIEVRDYTLSGIALDDPELIGVTVSGDGTTGVGAGTAASTDATLFDDVLFTVEVADSIDRWADHRGRTSEAGVDRSFLSVEFMQGVLGQLRTLHRAGLYGADMAWDVVERTSLLLTVEGDSAFTRVLDIPRSSAPRSTLGRTLVAEGWTWDTTPMVQWETPIPPAENDSILARLNTFPGVRVWHAADSYLGQPVWVAEFLPENAGLERGIVSQAKLNALKPTLFISGRQHANEVSSTSHILRLGALLATDPAHRALLDDVNVVLHPILNPDGARLAVEMQEINPDHMLHAGYLGSLGVDATSGERSADPIYPESRVRREVRETWLPDAYVNMHGYPSHEWVQYFAGYSAWVRSRRGGQRDWWSPRGWFIPGFGWVEDEENPEYTDAQFAMLDSVAASIRAEADVAAMSDEMYARYRKYGAQDRDEFREYFRSGILAYLSLNPASSIGQGVYSDRITYFSTTTEAPDETARGEWLDLVASAGLAHSTALLRYLANGDFDVEREAEAFDGVVTRRVYRVKPVLPREARDDGPGDSEG